MKKYLYIVLLVGFSFGQVVPDTLILKSGKTFLGKYLSKDETFTHFKNIKSTKKDRIRNSVIEEVRLGNGMVAKKVIFIGEVHRVSNHLFMSGKYLNNYFERSMYSLGFSVVGTCLLFIDEEQDDLLYPAAFFLGAFYNGIVAIFEVNKAGKELKKASEPMREIERKIKKQHPKK